jgi:hypothetical protein
MVQGCDDVNLLYVTFNHNSISSFVSVYFVCRDQDEDLTRFSFRIFFCFLELVIVIIFFSFIPFCKDFV